jgi:nucleoside phosphorylase/CheY-like chemotaxis protein
MRILIADDQARRYGRLVSALEHVGVQRNAIDIVSCANDARERLVGAQYDLLVLDILLPLWPESEPTVIHSLDLLLELHEGEELPKPRRILGITADLQLVSGADSTFESWTWTVLEYSESSDDWINRTVNCVRYIEAEERGSNGEKAKSLIDLAIVCALARPELEEVLKLPWNWSSSRPLDDQTFVHDGHFEVDGKTITVCATAAPRVGMVATSLRSATIIALLRPRLIAMCGICAGVKEKVEIADVLLADPAWDFQSGKRVRDGAGARFAFSPHQIPAAPLIRSHLEQIRDDLPSLARLATDFGSGAPRPPRIVIGPVATGSAVLADGEIINDIRAQHRELIGVEMESYGMYAAACSAPQPQPLAFALKSVCDFADSTKEDNFQRYAAYTSAGVLRLLMERFGSRLLGP